MSILLPKIFAIAVFRSSEARSNAMISRLADDKPSHRGAICQGTSNQHSGGFLHLRDAILADLENFMRVAVENEFDVAENLAVDLYRALRNQPARFAAGFREAEIHEETANPGRLR